MRTTLTLEDDVLQQAKAVAAKAGRSFKEIVNEALRVGLKQALKREKKPFRTEARPMGLQPGHSLDNVQDLLSQIEGEDHR